MLKAVRERSGIDPALVEDIAVGEFSTQVDRYILKLQ
jgi:hypothetical protein